MISLPTGFEAFILIGLAVALAAGAGALFALLEGRVERPDGVPPLRLGRVRARRDEDAAGRAA